MAKIIAAIGNKLIKVGEKIGLYQSCCCDNQSSDPCTNPTPPPCEGLPTISECCGTFFGSKIGVWLGPYASEAEANAAYDAYQCDGKSRISGAYQCGGQWYIDMCCNK